MQRQIKQYKVTEKNFKAWNDDMIDKYDPDIYHTKSNIIIRTIIRLMQRSMHEMLNPKSCDRTLEVGCGAGNTLEKFLSGKKTVGIDLSLKLLRKAQKRCGTLTELCAAKAEALPFKAKSFDKVVCTEVIEHLLFPEKCLLEIGRIAKDDAAIVITTTNEIFLNKIKNIVWTFGIDKILFRGDTYKPQKRMDDEWHLQAFDPISFKLMIEQYFNIKKIDYVPSQFFPVHIIVCCGKKR